MMLVNVQYSHCEVLYNQFFFFWTHNKRGMVIKCIKGELLLLVNEQQWSKKGLYNFIFPNETISSNFTTTRISFHLILQKRLISLWEMHTLHWFWKKGVNAVGKVDIFFVTACHPSSSKSPIVIPKVALLSGHLTYNRQVVICAHLCRSRSEDPINW